MSEITYDGYSELLGRVGSARRAWSRAYVTENIFKFATLFGGTLLLFTLLAAMGPVPTPLRWAMLGVLTVLLVGGSIRYIFGPLFRQWTDEEIAVHVESKFPEIDNAVINSLQLANDPIIRERTIVARIIRHAERHTRSIRFSDAIDRRGAARYGIAAMVLLAGLAVFAFGFSDAFGRAMTRILVPGRYVATVGIAHIIEVKPGTAVVIVGDPVPFEVTYRQIGPGEVEGSIAYTVNGADTVSRPMKAEGKDKFTFTLPELRSPLSYRVTVGGTESESYGIQVTERPAVTRIDIRYVLPAYTGLKSTVESDTNGDLKALAGTTAELTITASKALAGGTIKDYGIDVSLTVNADNPRVLTGRVAIDESGSYTIRVRDREGHANRSLVIHRVTALPDRAPTVRISVPGKDVVAEPGDKVRIAFEAKDDYGVALAEFVARREQAKTEGSAVASWKEFADRRNVQNTHTIYLDPAQFKPGAVLEYWVRVTDTRRLNGKASGQTARTPAFLIKVLDKQKVAEERIKNIKNWQERLRKVLEHEKAIRHSAVGLGKSGNLAEFAVIAAKLSQRQADARLDVMRIAGDIKPTDSNTRRVKEILHALAANEMAAAVKSSETVQKVPELHGKKAELEVFRKDVEKVIVSIQKILDILPKLEEQVRKESEDDEGFDLSEDAKEKLRDLERGLKDFIDEQKKVIDATQELAQKNVDDFTKEDDRKLKELSATEDKWSQFFIEKHNDLSKLPEQDLANSSLLKELLEVQSEVQMAKDALAKKAKEIATPIEENGLELAKTLETHIEKWLPDTPDRDKWKMEEPLGDADTPMAELPKELEDLVGDLMEEEEDLMEEVEDATAGYADSLDKGAGWDAMDGPISNMSAQGVTGNRLPNKSEIGGRSGEGRSGKSSGEFVEQDATGKGGRKTPTRLTPDAFEKGQVNDTSKDPMGGSTGGGKASGAGAGGLEGPLPPPVKAKLKNIAQRQAELRNRAEKINAKFKVMKWPTPFEETVKAMKLNEADLNNARYQNVLRRRPILLKNLKTTRQFLGEQVRVNRDYSTALPKYLQDEILDASQSGTPRGYEKLLKDYYKSISKQDN
jgi:hypothetical protein